MTWTEEEYASIERLVYTLAWRYYRTLPAALRGSVDYEDMVGMGRLHCVRVAPKYQPGKAKPSTFFYQALSNFYREFYNFHQAKRRQALAVVSIDVAPLRYCQVQSTQPRLVDARRRTERVYELASDSLRQFLSETEFLNRVTVSQLKAAAGLLNELRGLFQVVGASRLDFQLTDGLSVA